MGRSTTRTRAFDSRKDEVRALKTLCDGLPIVLSEFGYKTGTGEGFVTEEQQALNTVREWAFWTEQGIVAAFLYQLNDGQSAEEGFGIRWHDDHGGGWKKVAGTVPHS